MRSLEYLAGFFDGEGLVGLYKPNASGALRCVVNATNTDPAPLVEFQRMFAGRVTVRNSPGWKPCYQWQPLSRFPALSPHYELERNTAIYEAFLPGGSNMSRLVAEYGLSCRRIHDIVRRHRELIATGVVADGKVRS